MYWNDSWGWGGGLMMSLVMIAFWGFVAWAIVSLVRGSSRHGQSVRTPENTLAERFARGEIDEDEYDKRLTALRSRR